MTAPWSAEEFARYVEGSQFTTTRLRSGYDEEEVDAFLERIVETLRGKAVQPLTPAEADAAVFSTTRLRPGYDEEEVDQLLDTVKAFFTARSPRQQGY